MIEFRSGGEPRTTVANTQEPAIDMWELSASTKQQVLRLRNPVMVQTIALSRVGLQLDNNGEGADGSMINNKPSLQPSSLCIE